MALFDDWVRLPTAAVNVTRMAGDVVAVGVSTRCEINWAIVPAIVRVAWRTITVSVDGDTDASAAVASAVVPTSAAIVSSTARISAASAVWASAGADV